MIRYALALLLCSLSSLAWAQPATRESLEEEQALEEHIQVQPSALPSPINNSPELNGLPTRFGNYAEMEFILVPAGPFRYRPPGHSEDIILWVEEPYYLQSTEMTEQQGFYAINANPVQCVIYSRVKESCDLIENSSYSSSNDPMVHVHSGDVGYLIDTLNESSLGLRYRLPTAREWLKAAQAGQWQTDFWWGNDPKERVNHENCLAEGDHVPLSPFLPRDGYKGLAPVASYKPNPWGFYDMLGNVSEFIQEDLADGPPERWKYYDDEFYKDPKEDIKKEMTEADWFRTQRYRSFHDSIRPFVNLRPFYKYFGTYSEPDPDGFFIWDGSPTHIIGGNYRTKDCGYESGEILALQSPELFKYDEEDQVGLSIEVGVRLVLEVDSVRRYLAH